jgi:transcriptional regulator with XRE-family HTH domain
VKYSIAQPITYWGGKIEMSEHSIGEVLKQARMEKGLSLREAADKSGLSHSYIRYLENDERPGSNSPINATPETLKKLSEAYGVQYEDLMKIAGYLSDKGNISKSAQQLMEEYEYYLESYKTMQSALQKIANGCDNPQEVAKEALKEVTGEDTWE